MYSVIQCTKGATKHNNLVENITFTLQVGTTVDFALLQIACTNTLAVHILVLANTSTLSVDASHFTLAR